MKIYTKTGDQGETGLFAGPRVSKDDPRIEAYGTVDELNAVLGQVRAAEPPPEMDRLLEAIQNELFSLGAALASPKSATDGSCEIGTKQIDSLEVSIDQFEADLEPLQQFILPGGSVVAAHLHLARTVCRRAERRVITLWRMPDESISDVLVVYLNRLSDLLFVLARAANRAVGEGDVPWQKPS